MNLFAYGTLRSAELMLAVAGRSARGIPSWLEGHGVFPISGDVVPCIKPSMEQAAEGILYTEMTLEERKRLDLYEGAFGYELRQITVMTANGAVEAMIYFPPDDVAVQQGTWSLSKWENGHLVPAIHAANELFSHDPLPSHAELRRMWPMIEKRAWAKVRATNEDLGPATLRFCPEREDVAAYNLAPPQGSFFRLQKFQVDHRQFDGTRSGDLVREVFLAVDAVMVLPYDPARDRILLVEQIRMGPLMRADPNPWSLEPIAGMIDARETPLEAALRESIEEAGLTYDRTEKMMSFYPTPGGTTDYFTCYLGLCDLPEKETYSGGLDTESEDLRLHTVTFEKALSLVTSGEINAGPLIAMLYWLERERSRLRTAA
ncbi:nudix-type nucleoside diphosphatase, YffH/AdpP family [Cognatiyoonia koreensis]|uniref:ADP-ribose pyrophosphatase n=1 Tax=Cognatiyoonia koreensis TaxID=364200 RepID=A0A1I0PBJ1_9RHOB|nr:gamma-glutamylcyclotransferase [Cognatiyoonia koreensis]SEW11722.1 nudix-type nucleoside diphosphatase, YffH/AdpP family [Cognatiyoonia koreensis]